MRSNVLPFLILVAAIALAAPVAADEVVHFKDGKTMVIQSHEVDGDKINVDLGGGSLMSFSLDLVEAVERDGRNLLEAEAGGTANRRVRSDVGKVIGYAPDTRTRKNVRRASEITGNNGEIKDKRYKTDPISGLHVQQRFAGDSREARASASIHGNRQLVERGSSSGQGTVYRTGTGTAILKDDSVKQRPTLTPLTPRMTPLPRDIKPPVEAPTGNPPPPDEN